MKRPPVSSSNTAVAKPDTRLTEIVDDPQLAYLIPNAMDRMQQTHAFGDIVDRDPQKSMA